MGNIQVIPALCNKNVIYKRELASFGYCASSYWFVEMIYQLPTLIFTYTIYMGILFLMCQFEFSWNFFWYHYVLNLLTTFAAFYVAVFLAAATNSTAAFAIFPIYFMILSNFAGYTIPGMKWLSIVKYDVIVIINDL